MLGEKNTQTPTQTNLPFKILSWRLPFAGTLGIQYLRILILFLQWQLGLDQTVLPLTLSLGGMRGAQETILFAFNFRAFGHPFPIHGTHTGLSCIFIRLSVRLGKAWEWNAHFFWSLSFEPTNFMKFKHIVHCVIIDEILEKWTNYTQCTQAQLN